MASNSGVEVNVPYLTNRKIIENIGVYSDRFIRDFVLRYRVGVEHMPDQFKELIRGRNLSGAHYKSARDEISVTESFQCPKRFVLTRIAQERGWMIHFIDPYSWPLYRGKVWDEEMGQVEKQGAKTQRRVVLPVEDEVIGTFLVKGRYDVYFPEEDKVVDIKNTSDINLLRIPFKEHVYQVLFYAAVGGFRKAGLQYITNIAPVEVELDASLKYEVLPEIIEHARVRLRALFRALETGELPNFTPTNNVDENGERYYCRFCPFYEICPTVRSVGDFEEKIKKIYEIAQENSKNV